MTAACAIGAVARALVFGVGLAGCLVTDKIEYTEQDLPPRITVVSPGPLQPYPGSSQCGTEVGGDAPIDGSDDELWLKFVVNISDPNVDDELVALMLVNGMPDGPNSPLIPITGTVDRGRISFCARGTAMLKLCNLVELIVMRPQDIDYRTGSPYNINLTLTDKYALQSWVVLGENNRSGFCDIDPDAGFP